MSEASLEKKISHKLLNISVHVENMKTWIKDDGITHPKAFKSKLKDVRTEVDKALKLIEASNE